MKSSHSLISLLKEKPEFHRLKIQDEIKKLILSLPMEICKYIAFGFQKGDNLYFALKNPSVITEYTKYRSEYILRTLHDAQKGFPLIGKTKKITFYYPKPLKKNEKGVYFTAPAFYALYGEKVEVIYIQSFPEQSKGEFVNQATHPKLYKLFEEIRKTIKEKCQSSKH